MLQEVAFHGLRQSRYQDRIASTDVRYSYIFPLRVCIKPQMSVEVKAIEPFQHESLNEEDSGKRCDSLPRRAYSSRNLQAAR